VTGGGLSNLLDRILHDGGVTDFIIVAVGSLNTGIFNMADVYILSGSFILGFSLFSNPDH
jgi:signal peptidase II